MFRVRRFAVIRTANTVALMYVIGFLIVAVPLALLFSVSDMTVTDSSGRQTTIGISPLLFALLLPILYGIVGWVFTALACLLYNLTARFTGGIGVDVRNEAPAVDPAPPAAYPPAQG